MKNFLQLLSLVLVFSSCNQEFYYYQLVELGSVDIVVDNNSAISKNIDLQVEYDFWGDNGVSNLWIFNNSDNIIYIKHDECHLIKNDVVSDYYDNNTHSTSSSINEGVSYKRSNLYVNNSNTPINALASVLSATASSGYTESSSISKKDKLVLMIPPKSKRVIPGYILHGYRFWDCDIDPTPNRKKSREGNGLNFSKEDSPLKFRFYITYSFDEDFKSKNVFESSAYVKSISNWAKSAFLIEKSYKQCKDDTWPKNRTIAPNHSPMNFYIKYNGSSVTDH